MKCKFLPAVIAAIMIFSGCSTNSADNDTSETSAAETAFAVPETTAAEENTDSADIPESEIERLIEGRVYIRTVTEYDTLSFDSGVKIEHKGREYYKVSDSRFEKWNDWVEFVREIYTENIEEEILTQANTIGINGFTYTDGGGMGREWLDTYSYEPAGERGNGVAYTVKFPYAIYPEDGYYEETLVFAHTDSGWRIDSVILITN